MVEITLLVLGAVAVGLVEVAKRLGTPAKLLPMVAVAIGVGLSFLAYGMVNVAGTVITGLVIGLSSVGLYSGVKNTLK